MKMRNSTLRTEDNVRSVNVCRGVKQVPVVETSQWMENEHKS